MFLFFGTTYHSTSYGGDSQTRHRYSIHKSRDSIIIMRKVCGIFLVGLTVLFISSNSISSVSVEEAIQKRIEMFKKSKSNIKKLRQLIRSGDASKAVSLMDFHIKWSKEMTMLFPPGSEASTSNGSDASSDIWHDPNGFKNAINQYNLKSQELRKFLISADATSINQTFKSFASTCQGCHKRFRN